MIVRGTKRGHVVIFVALLLFFCLAQLFSLCMVLFLKLVVTIFEAKLNISSLHTKITIFKFVYCTISAPFNPKICWQRWDRFPTSKKFILAINNVHIYKTKMDIGEY